MGAEKVDVYDSNEWVHDMMGKPKSWLVDYLRNILRSSAPSASTNKASTKFLDRLEEILKGVPWAGAVCLKVEALRLVEKLRTLP